MASYAPAFSSYAEFIAYRPNISAILEKWGTRYLLGDVGITAINYANWGMLYGKPVCIDYAYIFPVSMDVFTCVCGNKEMKFADNTFTNYQCTNCRLTYTDRDLRAKISNDERLALFQNVSDNAIPIHEPTKSMEVSDLLVARDIDPDMPDPYKVSEAVNRAWGNPIL